MLSSPSSIQQTQADQAKSFYHAIFENSSDERYAISDTEPLLIDGLNPEQHYSFQQLRQHVITLSAVLRDEQPFHVKKGDVVTVYAPNHVSLNMRMEPF